MNPLLIITKISNKVGNNGSLGNASIVQKFWDSTLDLAPGDGDDCDGTQR